jgi:hypothetical protein
MIETAKIPLISILLFLVLPNSAYAYFDPGVGSIILQALAAGFLAVAVFWRRIINAIKKFFSKRDAEK